jgi:hypothetical protein
MTVSFLVDHEKITFAASGAVLVSLSIVAGLIHQKWPLRWIIERAKGSTLDDLPEIQPIGFETDRVSDVLKKLSRANEYDDKLGDWYVGTTAVRVDRYILVAIGVSAIIGSLVWGYA